MNVGILIGVIAYEVISIVGVGAFLAWRQKKKAATKDGFALAGRQFGLIACSVTLALTVLGSAHIWGTTENAMNIGATAAWLGVACAIFFILVTQCTGLLAKRANVTTIPELFGRLFGEGARTMLAVLQAGLIFGFLALETQCIAVTFQAITVWPYWVCAIVGGVIGTAYVLLAGMKEIGWLNILSAVVMYAGMIIALIALVFILPEYIPGGFEGVEQAIVSEGRSDMLSMFSNPAQIIAFSVPTILSFCFFHGWSQFALQPALSAKDDKTVRRSMWIAAPVNGMVCVIPVLIGLAAFAIPQFRQLGALDGPPALIVQLLPPWIVVILMAGFLGALLSTFAIGSLSPASLFAYDIYTRNYKPQATEKEKIRVMRIVMVIEGVLAIVVCLLKPNIISAINWTFSMLFPCSVFIFIGLLWKRSTKAMALTTVITIVINLIYSTFGLQAALGWTLIHVNYISIFFSVVLGLIFTAVLPGKPGLFKEIKTKRTTLQGTAAPVKANAPNTNAVPAQRLDA